MKSVLITGANAGIGFATAKFLAARPEWHVVLACRNESKANAAIAAMSERPSQRTPQPRATRPVLFGLRSTPARSRSVDASSSLGWSYTQRRRLQQ